jgi:hypothetical protein
MIRKVIIFLIIITALFHYIPFRGVTPLEYEKITEAEIEALYQFKKRHPGQILLPTIE